MAIGGAVCDNAAGACVVACISKAFCAAVGMLNPVPSASFAISASLPVAPRSYPVIITHKSHCTNIQITFRANRGHWSSCCQILNRKSYKLGVMTSQSSIP